MYRFKRIDIEEVKEISTWKYDGFMETIFMKPYFKNFESNPEVLKGPADCDGFAVYDNDQLFGMFEYYHNEYLEIGLAMHPNFVGKGLSTEFIKQGITFGVKEFSYKKDRIQLHVEIENKSAYHAYLKFGFKEISKNKEEILMYYFL